MDIHLYIVKHAEIDRAVSYSARLSIGRTDLALEKNSEEVFWCAAAGKDLTECITAAKERALLWAERERVHSIAGLLRDGKSCHPCLDSPPEVTILVPVTYNDWLTETKKA